MDMEGKGGHVWFGVAEIQEIFGDETETDISADYGQSEWSLADCQELLDVVLLKRKVTSVDYASEETASHILAKKNPEWG